MAAKPDPTALRPRHRRGVDGPSPQRCRPGAADHDRLELPGRCPQLRSVHRPGIRPGLGSRAEGHGKQARPIRTAAGLATAHWQRRQLRIGRHAPGHRCDLGTAEPGQKLTRLESAADVSRRRCSRRTLRRGKAHCWGDLPNRRLNRTTDPPDEWHWPDPLHRCTWGMHIALRLSLTYHQITPIKLTSRNNPAIQINRQLQKR